MFTDGPATPTRVEVLIEVLQNMGNRKYDRQSLYELLQPEGIPGLNLRREQARETLKAAEELGLLSEEREDGRIKLKVSSGTRPDASDILLNAIDERVLSRTDVEYYFALFYSYLLGANKKGGTYQRPEDWERDFNRDVYGNSPPSNKFNKDKYTGLQRWMSYAGLGWYDSDGVFQPNPYGRVRRCLNRVFAKQDDLSGDKFMERLAAECPELDGGGIFIRANPKYSLSNKTCTLGLSHALIDLHMDGILRLHCPRDSHGWSIASADPPYDNRYIKSDRIDHVELKKKR